MSDLKPNAHITRHARVLDVLVEVGLNRGVFVSSGRHLFTDMDPVVWLTGFKPVGRACVVFDDKDELSLLVDSVLEAKRAASGFELGSIQVTSDPFEEAARLLGSRNGGVSPVAVAGAGKLNFLEYKSLTAKGAVQLRHVDSELDARARLKDEEELANYRTATEIAEKSYVYLCENLRQKMTDVEAEALLERRLRELGSEDTFIFLSASLKNRAVQRPWGRILMPGDVLLMEISPSCGGVFSQICRTVVIGSPSDALVAGHRVLQEALEQGINACSAGNSVADVVSAIDERLIAEGFGEYCRPPFMRVRGHGMGFGSVAPGDFLSSNATILEEGDTFVLHPNQMLPTTGYLMCGEPVEVGQRQGNVVSKGVAGLNMIEV